MPAKPGAVENISQGRVKGFLQEPDAENAIDASLVLTHGAGANANAALLVALASAFCDAGWTVLRLNLPFRQKRPFGPPSPAGAAEDRAGLREAVGHMRTLTPARVALAGHSYGGRQASMLAAEEPGLADALLLLSYPLHPPNKPTQLRTAHFPHLLTPAFFAHGTKDPLGSVAEMETALRLVPSPTRLRTVEGAGHDLARGKFDPAAIALEFGYFATASVM